MTATMALLLLLVAGTLPGVVRWMLPPLPAAQTGQAQVVVVPGGGHRQYYGEAAPSPASLRRARRGLEAARERNLPILLSGGQGEVEGTSEAALMAEVIRRQWPEAELWCEQESCNTWENARNSAEMLSARGVTRILLVTDRPHLTRATLSFRAQGLEVIPLPVSDLPRPEWVPSAGALAWLPDIYYEWVGLVWYQIRYL